MLEESRMDKKSINRPSQQQSRASAIDCKKSTESTHKLWPRNNKKREGSGSAPKNEPYRKNAPAQRGRGQMDKRPRARGDATNFTLGGKQNTGLEEEDEPEIGSVFVPGSKKQNINHLLNFMYPSRGTYERGLERRAPDSRRNAPSRLMHRINSHDLYLRANCQFVVKECGDYKANLLDPDVPIKWEQVEEVVVRSTGRSECPICLDSPVAGRVGHCGHVYCWACVLHYAAAHEKQPPPCPVCTAPLQVKDMKPTRMMQWDSQAEEVTMCLVRRLRGSTTVEVAPPRGQYNNDPVAAILPLEDIATSPYAKFFYANQTHVQNIMDRERKEIGDQIMAEIDTTEIVFLEQALTLLKDKESKIVTLYQPPEIKEQIEDVPVVYQKQEVNANKIDWFDVDDDGEATCVQTDKQLEDVTESIVQLNLNPDAPDFVQNDVNDNQSVEFPLIDCAIVDEQQDLNVLSEIDKQNQAKYFYFYQADDGQQIFLNSLNVRVLNASWGALAAAPPIIRGRVLHRETLSLSEQMRKHMPYTAHLPLYCSFDIVELDVQPPFVTTEALKSFSEELERRARIRARHERDERRRERAYRRALEGPPKPDFTSDVLFPPASAASAAAAVIYATPPTDPPLVPLQVAPSTSATSTSPPGLSFAKMASTSGNWRVRKTVPPPVAPPEEEEGVPRSVSLSDAIEAALNAASSPSNKKKKKNKQKLLFTTGLQHTP